MYVCVYVCVCMCMHVYVCVCMCMYVCICVCVCVCILVCTCVCVYVESTVSKTCVDICQSVLSETNNTLAGSVCQSLCTKAGIVRFLFAINM